MKIAVFSILINLTICVWKLVDIDRHLRFIARCLERPIETRPEQRAAEKIYDSAEGA